MTPADLAQQQVALARGALERAAEDVGVFCLFVLDPIIGLDLRGAYLVEANAEEHRASLERDGKLATVIRKGGKV